MTIEAKTEDDNLAAEYVLGVLESDDRARVETRIQSDLDFARLVASWQENLSGLNDGFEEIAPPPSIKQAIDDQLFAADEQITQSYGLMGFLARYRIAIIFAVLFIALAPRFFAFYGQDTSQPQYIAQLSGGDDSYGFVAEISDGNLRVVQFKGRRLKRADFELWLVNPDSSTVSLGVLSGAINPGGITIPNDATLAVSVEPIGGSPTGVATGEIVAIGQLQPA